MITHRSLFGIACRAAALSFLVAGSASLMQAQSTSTDATPKAPLLLASASAPLDLASTTSSSSSSDTDATVDSNGRFMLDAAALNSAQPPPRRYGRPTYSGGNTNADGSSKYVFLAGGGLTLPVGDTHYYETPSWAVQGGGGRNFSKTLGVLLQFDYDNFGLQGATISNQNYIYDYTPDGSCTPALAAQGACGVTGLDGNSHVWSFTVNPTFTLPTTGSMGAYLVVGAGFYHKVTNFTEPTTEESCYYFCEDYEVNANIDHYTSNAPGFSGGFGLTYKFSQFSNEQFYMEARYVFMDNSPRTGVTASNVASLYNTYNGTDFYPANSHRTTYIPITFGLRF